MQAASASTRLRILHLGKFYPPVHGGMETYLRDLCTGLERAGTRCLALVHAQEGPSRTCIDDPVPGSPTVVRAATWGRLLYTPISPTLPLLLHRYLQAFDPAILHLHLPNPSALAALVLPAARRLPWVLHWHADIIANPAQHRLALAYRAYRPAENALLKRAAAIIATSGEYLNSSPALQSHRPRCRVIPLGRDIEVQPQRPAPSPVQLGPLRVVAAGRLTCYKGFDILLHALALAPDVVLTLVGDGEARSTLARLVRDLRLEDRVTLLGAISDAELASCIAAADCLVLPSLARTEAFGLVLLEAMAAGIATIASAVPGSGILEVVEQGVTGLLVPPGDPQALAGALTRLRDNRDQAQAMGRNGALRFAERYRIDTNVKAVLGLYLDILGSRQ
jgi:glycosyltransferase involved in cell wall biosynthesis